jgi:hypothetical protein
MLTVITTIAQHYKSYEMHLRNLAWALDGLDHQVFVMTFKNHKLQARAQLLEVDADPADFYFFYDELDMGRFNSDLLLMEQDILFTHQIRHQRTNQIVLNMHSNYLSIFDQSNNIIYPRIWEGATWLPHWLVKRVTDYSFGYTPKKFRPHTEEYNEHIDSISNSSTTFGSIADMQPLATVLARPRIDTMFEVSIYCYLHNIPYQSYGEHDYQYGKNVIHLRGIDSICRNIPNIYSDIDAIGELEHPLQPAYFQYCNDCALMLLLSGMDPSPKVRRWLTHTKNIASFKIKLERLLLHSDAWMTNDEIAKLRWAYHTTCVSLL